MLRSGRRRREILADPVVACLLMPTDQILALLIQERDRLNQAIEALQGPMKRRGRPPKSGSALVTVPASVQEAPRKKRIFSAAQRKKQAERMKAYWAAKRKQSK